MLLPPLLRSPWVILIGWLSILGLCTWLAPTHNITAFFLLCAIFFYGQSLGRVFLPSATRGLQIFIGVLTILACQSILQTAWYYTDHLLTHRTDILTLIVTLVGLEIAVKIWPHHTRLETADLTRIKNSHSLTSVLWLALTLVPAVLATFFVLANASAHATTEAIRTPWPLFPHGLFVALVIIFLSAWLAAWKTRSAAWTVMMSALMLASITLIAPLIYTLGFGFDGFLHRASEHVLLTTGTLNPHPPYYIGQYVFVTWLSRLLKISLDGIDILLVPLATALLPFGLLIAHGRQRISVWMIALLPALLPLSVFVATTPQSFAYLLGFLGLCLALTNPKITHPVLPALALGGWCLATHPLAGLPCLAAIGMVLMLRHQPVVPRLTQKIIKYFFVITCFAVGLIAIPTVFFFRSAVTDTHWNLTRLSHLSTYTQALEAALSSPNIHVSLWADWASFVDYLFPFVLILLAGLAIWRDGRRRSLWVWLTLFGIGLSLTGFFLQTTASFTFLIDYERGNFADRLFILSELILLFPALTGLGLLLERQKKSAALLVIFTFFFGGTWFAARAYLAMPRHDAVVVGHGWSVGRADQDAVYWIDHDAGLEPYTVLANQSTSAAAIEAFGFKRYVGDVFYYPIPTGGPLYEKYLQAVAEEPALTAIQSAATLGKSSLVYVVLNNYWWQADQVADALSRLAEKSVSLDDGRVRIYRFRFKTSSNN